MHFDLHVSRSSQNSAAEGQTATSQIVEHLSLATAIASLVSSMVQSCACSFDRFKRDWLLSLWPRRQMDVNVVPDKLSHVDNCK